MPGSNARAVWAALIFSSGVSRIAELHRNDGALPVDFPDVAGKLRRRQARELAAHHNVGVVNRRFVN